MTNRNGEKDLRRRAMAVLSKPLPRFLRERSEELQINCPWFFIDAYGARIYTIDGRYFLDLEMGRGPNLLGYRHPELEEAISSSPVISAKSSLLSEIEIEVAEILVDLFPCAEKVVFGKNGSDACTAAVRVARTITGKSTILSTGFHGFHDWCAADYPWKFEGLPDVYRGLVKSFDLNDYDTLMRLAYEHRNDLSAIFIEPAHHTLPESAFLRKCRKIADEYGAILIFDEIVTAFRLDIHGAQGLYGVIPDLACLGKAMANGEAISALIGKTDIMKALDRTYFSMTFQNDNRVLTTARCCLNILQNGIATESVRYFGEKLRRSFDDAAIRYGLPHRAIGFPGRMNLFFEKVGSVTDASQEQLFYSVLLKHQILPTNSVFACAMITEDDLKQAAIAFDDGMETIAKAL